MDKVSILIPSRNEPYLNKTVNDLFEKAKEDIEIIVMLDAYWPDPQLPKHDNLVIVHTGSIKGMRNNINSAARIATGKYIMKVDAHCMFDKNFDKVLKDDCEENWLSVPSRYSLDPEKWECKNKPAIEYLYITYPYAVDDMYGIGFNGRKLTGTTRGTTGYYEPEQKYKDKLIDDIMIFQGSCWFMHKKYFEYIDGLDENLYNIFQEASELTFKVWLSGGRVIRNKKTWYAHLHKNKDTGGRGFKLSKRQMNETKIKCADYWMNNQWPKQTKNIEWLINKFQPLQGWPADWNKSKEIKKMTQKEVNKAIKKKFRIKPHDTLPFTGWLKPSNREDLFKLMNEMGGFQKGAEIGVALGKNAKVMLDCINGLSLTLVDPWIKYGNHLQKSMDNRYNNTLERLKSYKDRTQIIRKTSMDAVKQIDDNSLDFVYIDGFHDFDYIMSDLIFWVPKVRSGGIIAGHDYYPFYRAGIIAATNIYTQMHNINVWYVTREEKPSFFWVK